MPGDVQWVRRTPTSPCCPDLLTPHRVAPFHEWFPAACAELQAQREIRSLVADRGALLIDGRLVITRPSGRDPGGSPV